MKQTFIFVVSILFLGTAIASATPVFDGGKSTWHGFNRYDFIMDDQTLTITPFNAPRGEGDGINVPPDGKHRCVVVVPKEFAPGNPWSWRGCYWNYAPQAEIELLHKGFCIAYISANWNLKPGRQWDAWYAFLTEHGLSPKPVFIGMSMGGNYAYTWATDHPDKVSCIYGDNPYVPTALLMKIGALATNDVPLLHVCGSLDPLLGNCSMAVENNYQQFGGRISVMIKEGDAHHPHSLTDPKPIVDFVTKSVYETNVPPPVFVGNNKFTKTFFYGTGNFYRYFPNEGKYITCRGPMFTPCYDRYQIGFLSVKLGSNNFSGGGLTVIVPKTPAPGNPWVFRADFVDRNQTVDLALLAKGYYIVTGPVPFDVGPVPAQWDATYKYLTSYGFSKKPVMEGDGAAAGEAYAWAMTNPDKVSCIFGENPIMHSNLSKIALLDSLDILAKAGIPLIIVSGYLDPSFKTNTLIIEKRYKKLGGKIQVIVNKGEGHYPLGPIDPKPVVDFILKANLD
jgi:hypothetical protein